MEYLYSKELPWDVFVEETKLPLYTAYVVSCLRKHFILYVKGCSYYFLVNITSTLQFH